MISIIGHIAIIWISLSVFTVIVGVSLASRLPIDDEGENQPDQTPEPAQVTAYIEPSHTRKQRESFTRRRSPIYLAAQKERAEALAEKVRR